MLPFKFEARPVNDGQVANIKQVGIKRKDFGHGLMEEIDELNVDLVNG